MFNTSYEFLFDFNLECFKTILELLNQDIDIQFTEKYSDTYKDTNDDFRSLISAKTSLDNYYFKPYHQVFENKHGFIPNLSILDLLFNLGPESVSILKS